MIYQIKQFILLQPMLGGYGQNISSFYGTSDMLVKNFGISKKFHTEFTAEDLLKENGMSVENISNIIENMLQKDTSFKTSFFSPEIL